MTLIDELPQTVDEWLERSGWQADASKPGRWRREDAEAVLTRKATSSGWESWFLIGGATRAATGDPLIDNAALYGPGKWVRVPKRGLVPRFDLCRDLPEQGEAWATSLGETGRHPQEAWVEAVTLAAFGRQPEAGIDKLPVEDVIRFLVPRNWAGTPAEGAVRVSVPMPGLFRQVMIEPAPDGGCRCRAELVDLAGWEAASRQGALHLARVANVRLRLARLQLVGGARQDKLVAEVHLARAPVPGAWLEAALEALHSALALTARELSALRDPGLAQWYLAGQPARKEG